MGQMLSSERALELAEFAKRLRLTPLQTGFALALAADPKGNQTRSAVAAGASAKSAHVWASRTRRLAKVQRFLAKVGEAAQEEGRRRSLADPGVAQVRESIMASAEHQLQLSRMGRADIGRHLEIDQDGNVQVRIDPAYTDSICEVRVEERTDKDGMPVRRTTIRVTDPVPALQALARVRGWDGPAAQPNGPNPLWTAVLGELPQGLLKKTYLRMLQASSGNGTSKVG